MHIQLYPALLLSFSLLGACGGHQVSSRPAAVKGRPLAAEHLAGDSVAHHIFGEADLGDTPLGLNPNVALGHPGGSDEEILISRSQYVLSWNKSRRQVNWAAWRLNEDDLGLSERQKNFTIDKDLDAYLSLGLAHAVKPTDYKGTCFDRGHQVPSGDRTAWDEDNKATFAMSNIIPQTAYLNRVTWEHLEHHARDLVRGTGKTLYILSGPIFGAFPGYIGPDLDIAVAAKNFKIIVQAPDSPLDPSRPKVLASVIMPNTTSTGTDPFLDHAQACLDAHQADEFFAANNSSAFAADWDQFRAPLATIAEESGLDLSYLE